jgi:uncharacterized membrane protein YeiB
MDIGSIVSNALGGIIASLFILLLVGMGKQIQAKRKQRAEQAKEVLDKALLDSQEYKDILSSRKLHRIAGYAALIWFLSLIAVIIIAWVLNGKLSPHYKSIWDTISSIGLLISLACFSPLALYLGYSPITSQEVERKRQAKRQRKLKEALGARPYGYIFQEIIFPVIFWLYFIFCVIGLILFLALPPPIVHLPSLLVVVVSGLAIIGGLFGTYIPRDAQRGVSKRVIK